MMKLKKPSTIQILNIIALVVVLVLLFPIPMSRSREESYITTSVINYPYQIATTAQWNITWYIMAIDRSWGPSIGTQTADATFLWDWGNGVVYGGHSDGVGFIAHISVYVNTPGIYTFTLGSDDGSKLYIDGNLVIDNWRDQYYTEISVKYGLGIGWHNMSMNYYEYLYGARVYFDVDKGDLFTSWATEYLPLTTANYANRTVSETVYTSILEYLIKGGKP